MQIGVVRLGSSLHFSEKKMLSRKKQEHSPEFKFKLAVRLQIFRIVLTM